MEKEHIRLNHLDFYKGICILFIIFTHYKWSDEQRLAYFFPFWIDMAVPVFMVITGYVSAMSFRRREIGFLQAYQPKEILIKWLRFIIPFTPVFACEVFVYFIAQNKHYSLITLFKDYISGGYGPGSYYFPIMLQIVLLLPLIWNVVKKYEIKGLVLCFIFNVLFEALKTAINLSPGLYRLCSLRYVFVVAYGCYLYETKDKQQKTIASILAGILGIVYIVACNYLSYQPIITDQWKTTSVFAVLFIVPIMMLLIKQYKVSCGGIELLGKASFNIFLTQMAFYSFGAWVVYKLTDVFLLRIMINFTICCGIGVLFYKIENPITQKIIRSIKAK